MRRLVFLFFGVVALSTVTQAQSQSSAAIDSLTNRLAYFQKKAQYLAKRSKGLTQQVSKLNTRNRKLVLHVEALRQDSVRFKQLLEESYAENKRLVKAYELRIQGMAGELRALHDSVASLRVVKHDLDVIKGYFATARLAKREYDLPVDKVIQALNDLFIKQNSPYKIKSISDKELVITEDFTLKRQTLLFIKANVQMQGEYKLIMKPHPFDDDKTLVDLRDSLVHKRGDMLVTDNSSVDQLRAESRLFSFIDKAIY